jgi:hypothetical protein
MAKVISLIGQFPNPWKTRIKDEINRIETGQWSPTDDDFYANAVSRKLTCTSFLEFMSAIYNNPPRSVAQVNVLTHGSRSSIPFKGTVHNRTGIVTLNHSTALNDTVLQNAEKNSWKFKNDKGREVEFWLKDVKSRFAKNAKIVFYACHSGIDLALLKNVATTFNVQVLGFSKEIAYCPSFKRRPPSIDRRRIGVGSCKSPKRKLSLLTPDRQVKPRKANP